MGHFHFLATVNRTAVSTHMQVSVQKCVSSPHGHVSRRGTAISQSNSRVNILRNWSSAFHSVCTILQSHPQSPGAAFLHIPTSTCFYLVLVLDVLVGLKCFLSVLWARISLMTNVIVTIFSCASWLFVYPLWRNVHSDSLPHVCLCLNTQTDSYTNKG